MTFPSQEYPSIKRFGPLTSNSIRTQQHSDSTKLSLSVKFLWKIHLFKYIIEYRWINRQYFNLLFTYFTIVSLLQTCWELFLGRREMFIYGFSFLQLHSTNVVFNYEIFKLQIQNCTKLYVSRKDFDSYQCAFLFFSEDIKSRIADILVC